MYQSVNEILMCQSFCREQSLREVRKDRPQTVTLYRAPTPTPAANVVPPRKSKGRPRGRNCCEGARDSSQDSRAELPLPVPLRALAATPATTSTTTSYPSTSSSFVIRDGKLLPVGRSIYGEGALHTSSGNTPTPSGVRAPPTTPDPESTGSLVIDVGGAEGDESYLNRGGKRSRPSS